VAAERHSTRHDEFYVRRLNRRAPVSVLGVERVVVPSGEFDDISHASLLAALAAGQYRSINRADLAKDLRDVSRVHQGVFAHAGP
jgi:hypothetical protein